jgi:hypothetical protein
MTITFPDTNDHQTTPNDTPAQTEPIDITAAQILVDLSSSSPTPIPGTPPLGDQLRPTPPFLPISLFATGLSVPNLCTDRTGFSDFANNYLNSGVDNRIQIVLEAVKYVLSSTPRLRPRTPTPSAAAVHLKRAREALLLTNNPPRHPQLRSYRDVLESRPKPSIPPPRQLVPLGRPRPTTSPTRPPPIPYHSRPTRPASSNIDPSITTALASLPRKQLIDLLREVLGRPPLANVAPQFRSFRTPRRRAFRSRTLNSALQGRAYPAAPNQLRRSLQPQSYVFAQAHSRRQRATQRPRR